MDRTALGARTLRPSVRASVWRLTGWTRAIDRWALGQLGPPQGAVRGRILCQAALFAPFRNGSAQGRYCTYTEEKLAPSQFVATLRRIEPILTVYALLLQRAACTCKFNSADLHSIQLG